MSSNASETSMPTTFALSALPITSPAASRPSPELLATRHEDDVAAINPVESHTDSIASITLSHDLDIDGVPPQLEVTTARPLPTASQSVPLDGTSTKPTTITQHATECEDLIQATEFPRYSELVSAYSTTIEGTRSSSSREDSIFEENPASVSSSGRNTTENAMSEAGSETLSAHNHIADHEPRSSMSSGNDEYLRALRNATFAAVDWDFVLSAADQLHGSTGMPRLANRGHSSHSITQQLVFDDDEAWLVRVPLLRSPELPPSEEDLTALSKQVSNGVATLRYVEGHTDIPVPQLHFWAKARDGEGAGLPFRIESRPYGIPLSRIWCRLVEKRSFFLHQIAHLYLELSYKCRFPNIGSLYTKAMSSICELLDGNPYKEGPVLFPPPLQKHCTMKTPSSGPFTYGLDYLHEVATACLDSIRLTQFGSKNASTNYLETWIVRSLLPYVYHYGHGRIDSLGFSLFPGDFSLDNILVDLDAEGGPTLTGLRDWDFSCTLPNSSFAQFPLWLRRANPCSCGSCTPIPEERPARLTRDQRLLVASLHSQEIGKDIWIPITCHLEFSHLARMVEEALRAPREGAAYEIWDQVYAGIPQRGEMYRDAVEGYLRGDLRKVMAAFERDREVRERIERVLGDSPGNGRELLERLGDVAELEEEREYLQAVVDAA